MIWPQTSQPTKLASGLSVSFLKPLADSSTCVCPRSVEIPWSACLCQNKGYNHNLKKKKKEYMGFLVSSGVELKTTF